MGDIQAGADTGGGVHVCTHTHTNTHTYTHTHIPWRYPAVHSLRHTKEKHIWKVRVSLGET